MHITSPRLTEPTGGAISKLMDYTVQLWNRKDKGYAGALMIPGAIPLFHANTLKELKEKIIKWRNCAGPCTRYSHPRFFQYDYDPEALYDDLEKIELTPGQLPKPEQPEAFYIAGYLKTVLPKYFTSLDL